MNAFWSLKSAGLSLATAALTLLVNALPAEAVLISTLQTYGQIGTGEFQTDTLSNERDGSADPVGFGDNGDDAASQAMLMGSDGFLTLLSHGCSGPPPGFFHGTSNAVSSVDYYETFVIQSGTLAFGTPVTINIKVATAQSSRVKVDQPIPNGLIGSATVGAAASIGFNSGGFTKGFQGEFAAQQIANQEIFRTSSGIFTSSSGEFTWILPGTVGGSFFINVGSQLGANSDAFNPVESTGEGRMTLVWGADVVGGLAEIRSPTDGFLFRPTTDATGERALALLPPSVVDPVVGPAVPEPSSLALLSIGGIGIVVGAIRRRRQRQMA